MKGCGKILGRPANGDIPTCGDYWMGKILLCEECEKKEEKDE